jgi:hypothetical protein
VEQFEATHNPPNAGIAVMNRLPADGRYRLTEDTLNVRASSRALAVSICCVHAHVSTEKQSDVCVLTQMLSHKIMMTRALSTLHDDQGTEHTACMHVQMIGAENAPTTTAIGRTMLRKAYASALLGSNAGV